MSGKTAIVACHPDDEVLWFSSVLDKVDRVFICLLEAPQFPLLAAGRLKVKEEYPLGNLEWLELRGSQAGGCADWTDLKLSEFGVEVPKSRVPEEYERSFRELQSRLKNELQGFSRVYTHNPWGEYGHEEHIQVHRVVQSLQAGMGFEVLFSNYSSQHSLPLALKHTSGFKNPYETLATNAELSDRIKKLFQKHSCWTWYDDWEPFAQECFMKLSDLPPLSDKGSGHLFPLNMIRQERS
jgi:LmbE family N-acetylglucosaminyl deacetylase